MSYHVRDYHLVLDKKRDAPHTLTERDIAVAHEFGGPQEEQRFRDALKKAQLAILTKAEGPLQTKAAERPTPSTPPVLDQRLARVIGTAISRSVVVPIGERLGALTRRIEELETLTKQQAATLVDLTNENRALGQLVVNTQRPTPSVDRTSSTKH